MTKIFVIILTVTFLLPACQSTGCLKLEGGKDDYTGSVEYCFSAPKSEEA